MQQDRSGARQLVVGWWQQGTCSVVQACAGCGGAGLVCAWDWPITCPCRLQLLGVDTSTYSPASTQCQPALVTPRVWDTPPPQLPSPDQTGLIQSPPPLTIPPSSPASPPAACSPRWPAAAPASSSLQTTAAWTAPWGTAGAHTQSSGAGRQPQRPGRGGRGSAPGPTAPPPPRWGHTPPAGCAPPPWQLSASPVEGGWEGGWEGGM